MYVSQILFVAGCVLLLVLIIREILWRRKPEFIVERNMLTDEVRVMQKQHDEFGWKYGLYVSTFPSVQEATLWVNEVNAQVKRDKRTARGWMRVA